MRNFDVVNKNAKYYSPRELGEIYNLLTSSEGLTSLIITTPSLAYLEELLREHHSFYPNILGIGGGDGTASQTLTLVKKTWREIPEYVAPLPMGTMNDYALSLGLERTLLQSVQRKDTPSLRMARYIRDSVEEGNSFNTKKLGLLEVNDRSGFNIGFGIVPKLLWLYYGRTIEQYQRLEKELQKAEPERYEKIFGKIVSERSVLDDLIDIVQGNGSSRSGLISSLKAGTTGIKGAIMGAMGIPSAEHDFFNEPLDVEISIEGNKLDLPYLPSAVMTASYPQMNLGLKNFYLAPIPEARDVLGKMQVVVTYLTPAEILTQIPRLFRGQRLKKTDYFHAKEFTVKAKKPISCLVDGDFIHSTEFKVRVDRDVNLICLG